MCIEIAWRRLQTLSCHHAAKIGPVYGGTHRRPCVHVPEVIRENVEILGSGDEERIKARVLWYMDMHPMIFDAVLVSPQELAYEAQEASCE